VFVAPASIIGSELPPPTGLRPFGCAPSRWPKPSLTLAYWLWWYKRKGYPNPERLYPTSSSYTFKYLYLNFLYTFYIHFWYNRDVDKIQEVVKIGTQLRAAREQALLTQEELGTQAGVQPLTISRIETDKVEPRFSTIRKLAKALGMEPTALLPKE
jgi:DNA-binding XRE family transcriptional regulator